MAHRLQDIIKRQHGRRGSILFPLLLLLGGGLMIARLLNLDPIFSQIPVEILEWASGVGSVIGGIYMIFRMFYHRKIII